MQSHLVRLRCIERQFPENLVQQQAHSLLQLYHPLAKILAESVQSIYCEVMKIIDKSIVEQIQPIQTLFQHFFNLPSIDLSMNHIFVDFVMVFPIHFSILCIGPQLNPFC